MRKKVFGLIMSLGLIFGMGQNVMAEENDNPVDTAYVASAAEFTEALANESIDHVIITEGFEVPCKTAGTSNKNGTSYFVVNRTMTIEGQNPSITLKRTIEEGASDGMLQSLIGIRGNGEYDGIKVSIYNLILDGGADFGESVNENGYKRVTNPSDNSGCSGRSLVDVYYKATLNLESGATIQNSYTSYSLSSLTNNANSYNYGGGVRVDWDEKSGGGIVNLKAGSCIRNTAAKGTSYGGAIGSYSYSYINIFGGTIENCSATYGGAVGCTNRNGYPSSSAGLFNMKGGVIRYCSAERGGAIAADGDYTCNNCLLGGTIEYCTAEYGGSVYLSGSGNSCSSLTLAPYEKNGPLSIHDCVSNKGPEDPENGYSGLYIGNEGNINRDQKSVTITFKKFKDDTENYADLSVLEGNSLGSSFPGNPIWEEGAFIGWNTKADGTGTAFTDSTEVTENTTVYARWLLSPVVSESENSSYTYGDADKKVSVTVELEYGGNLTYKWFACDDKGENETEITAADGAEYNLPKLGVGTHYFKCVVRNTVDDLFLETVSKPIAVEVAPKTIELKWSDTSFTHDGEDKLPKAEVKEGGILEGDDCSITVSGKAKDIGKYLATAELTGADSANYVVAVGNDTISFEIVKKEDDGQDVKPVKLNLTEYYTPEKIKASQITPNLKIVDKKSAGKYKITKVIKKKGKIIGGTVTYMQPYSKNCKVATINNNIKIAGVSFKVTALNDNAFKNCKKLAKVTIGTNVQKIGKNSFYGCKSLKNINIRATKLSKIGNNAIKGINKKATIKVPKKSAAKYKKLLNAKAGYKKSMTIK